MPNDCQKIIILLLLLLIFIYPAPGHSGASLLNSTIGIKASGLAGAFYGLSDDISAIHSNPAGLNSLYSEKKTGICYNYQSWLNMTGYHFIGFGTYSKYGIWGLSAVLYGLGEMDIFDEKGIRTGEQADYGESVYSLAYANTVMHIPFGISLKYFNQDFPGYTGSSISADFGILKKFRFLSMKKDARNAGIGVGIKNFALKTDLGDYSIQPPFALAGGISYSLEIIKRSSITFLGQCEYNLDDKVYFPALGVDVRLFGIFSIRSGYRFNNEVFNFCLGGGINYNTDKYEYVLDYNFSPGLSFQKGNSGIHQLGITFWVKDLFGRIMGKISHINIGKMTTGKLFPSLYKYYSKNPIGSIEISNPSEKEIQNVKISLFVKEYMNFPTSPVVVPVVKAGEKKEIDLNVLFNNKIFSIPEGTPLQAEIKIKYMAEGEEKIKVETREIYVHNRNAFTWTRLDKLASFVTLNDPAVKIAARPHLMDFSDEYIAGMDDDLVKAMLIFDILGAMKINYEKDPTTPHDIFSKDGNLVDHIQYPREVLRFKSGDCDDCTVLYCSLLENVGIPTAFIDVRDKHIFCMFNVNELDTELLGEDMYIKFPKEKGYWIPIEPTMFKQGFYKSWEKAAGKYKDYLSQELITTAEVRQSWSNFPAVTLPHEEWEPDIPEKQEIAELYNADKLSIENMVINNKIKKIASYEYDEPGERENKIGIVYAMHGRQDKALKYFNDALEKHPNKYRIYSNLGNTYLIMTNYSQAETAFNKAIELSPDKPNAYINLAILYYQKGEFDKSKDEYNKAKKIDSEALEEYEYLKEPEADGERKIKPHQQIRMLQWE